MEYFDFDHDKYIHDHKATLLVGAKRKAAKSGVTPSVFGARTTPEGLTPNGTRTASSELLGHGDVSMTMIDTHVLRRGAGGAHSPLDTI